MATLGIYQNRGMKQRFCPASAKSLVILCKESAKAPPPCKLSKHKAECEPKISNGTKRLLMASTVIAPTAFVSLASGAADLYHPVDDQTMITYCYFIGGSFAFLSLLLTCRFILSFFPSLEKNARRKRGPMACRILTVLDPFLDPAKDGFFSTVESDAPNYATMLYLAGLCAILELLIGPGGLLEDQIPDTSVLLSLRCVLIWQQTLLLPQWALAVFRAYKLL